MHIRDDGGSVSALWSFEALSGSFHIARALHWFALGRCYVLVCFFRFHK